MPFVVKATYRRETRKFSFSDGHFPTYDELYQQLNRVFSIVGPVYLTRLQFSPQDHGGILIGIEVHTQAEYDVHCNPFSNHIYPNGRLTFTVMNEHTPVPTGAEPTSFLPIPTSMESFPPSIDASEQMVLPTPPPHVFRHLHSQRISEYRSSVSMDVDSESESQIAPPKQCCNINSSKREVQDLLDTFLRDFRRTIVSAGFNSGQSFFDPLDTPTMKHEKPLSRGGSPLPPLNLDASLHIPGSYMQASKLNDAKGQGDKAAPQLEPSQTLHPGIWCDFCGKQIKGLRFNCQECPEYDLCANCIVVKQAISKHNTDKATFHRFNVINSPEPNNTTTGNAKATGQGGIQNPNFSEPVNTSAPATTTTETESNPRVHTHIICDSCDEYIVGSRFKCLNCPDYDLCNNCINNTSMPHLAEHYFMRVEIPSRLRFHTTPVPVCDTSEPSTSVVVQNARCNLCDSRILGTRYKCTDCPDFDTCAACFAITPEQHPSHTFVRVSSPKDYLLRRNSATVRHFATCDVCEKAIVGIRYKCMHPECPDFDLCQNCEALPIPVHPIMHPFLKLKHKDTFIPNFRDKGEPRLVVELSSAPATQAPESVTPALAESAYQTPQESPSPHAQPASISPSSPVDRLNFIRAQAERRLSARIHQLQSYPFSSGPITTTPNPAVDPAIEEPISRESRETEEKARVLDREIERLRRQKHNDALKQSMRPYLESIRSAFTDEPETYHTILKLLIDYHGSTQDTNTHTIKQKIRTLLEGKPELQHGLDNLVSQGIPTGQPVQPASLQPTPNISQPFAQLPPPVPNVQPSSQATTGPEMSQRRNSLFSGAFVPQNTSPLAAVFVSDNNILDGHTFPSGAEFVKGWRVKNEGTEVWDGVELSFVGGDRLASVNAPLSYPVARAMPGQDINVDSGLMRAPEIPGRYMSYWRLHDAQGRPFGPRMWCDIEVIETESDSSQHGSLANSSVVMPINPSQMSNAEIYTDLLSPGIAPSAVSTLTDDASSVGSASLVEATDSDWDDIPDAPNTTGQGQVNVHEEYQVLYDSGSDRGHQSA